MSEVGFIVDELAGMLVLVKFDLSPSLYTPTYQATAMLLSPRYGVYVKGTKYANVGKDLKIFCSSLSFEEAKKELSKTHWDYFIRTLYEYFSYDDLKNIDADAQKKTILKIGIMDKKVWVGLRESVGIIELKGVFRYVTRKTVLFAGV